METNCRHIWALTKKNAINWRRTWFGSFVELVFPILCMLAVCAFRNYEDPVILNEEGYTDKAYA